VNLVVPVVVLGKDHVHVPWVRGRPNCRQHLVLEIRQGVYHFLNDRLPECHKKVLAEVAVAEGIVQVVDVVVRKERHFDQLYCPDSKTGEIHFGHLEKYYPITNEQ